MITTETLASSAVTLIDSVSRRRMVITNLHGEDNKDLNQDTTLSQFTRPSHSTTA